MNVSRPPALDELGGVGSAQFREAMSRVAAAVHVVTTQGTAGIAGVTVTAVAPVSDDPPSVLVCLARRGSANAVIRENGVFCVNVLPEASGTLADAFAGRLGLAMEERFARARWTRLATGSPVLVGARAAFDCRLARTSEFATHSIMIGTVAGVRIGPAGAALGHVERGYRDI